MLCMTSSILKVKIGFLTLATFFPSESHSVLFTQTFSLTDTLKKLTKLKKMLWPRCFLTEGNFPKKKVYIIVRRSTPIFRSGNKNFTYIVPLCPSVSSSPPSQPPKQNRYARFRRFRSFYLRRWLVFITRGGKLSVHLFSSSKNEKKN